MAFYQKNKHQKKTLKLYLIYSGTHIKKTKNSFSIKKIVEINNDLCYYLSELQQTKQRSVIFFHSLSVIWVKRFS